MRCSHSTDKCMFAAGDYRTIPAGHLYCLEAHEPTIVVYCRWLCPLSGLESLFATQTMWSERGRDFRLKYIMPGNARLGDAWGEFVEYICNNVLNEINHPFTLIPGVKTSAWGRTTDLPYPLSHGNRPICVFALASVAQACMPKNALMIGEIPQRYWGRLNNWCKANLGSSSTQKEREHTRGGRPAPEHDSETEEEMQE
jgi:hypothetical protein